MFLRVSASGCGGSSLIRTDQENVMIKGNNECFHSWKLMEMYFENYQQRIYRAISLHSVSKSNPEQKNGKYLSGKLIVFT